MASSRAATRLTEAHRLAQARLGAKTVLQLRSVWSLLDPLDLDSTVARWIQVARPVIEAQHTLSSRLAANYYRTFRSLELGTTVAFNPVVAAAVTSDALVTSLTITGPATIKPATARGASIEQSSDVALARSSAAGQRHALAGGRDTLIGSTNADPRAIGAARVTSGSPCAFCLMVASRGPVYKDEESASFQPHDACNCQPETVFRGDADWPPGAREAEAKWHAAQSDAGLSGDLSRGTSNDALNAFRRSLNT